VPPMKRQEGVVSTGVPRTNRLRRKEGIEEKEIGQWTIYISYASQHNHPKGLSQRCLKSMAQVRFCSKAFPAFDLLAALPLPNANFAISVMPTVRRKHARRARWVQRKCVHVAPKKGPPFLDTRALAAAI
jgi:hypothetical protein